MPDAGVGALTARAGLEGTILNVLINLGEIEDTHSVAAMRACAQALTEEGSRLEAGVLARARAGFGVISQIFAYRIDLTCHPYLYHPQKIPDSRRLKR